MSSPSIFRDEFFQVQKEQELGVLLAPPLKTWVLTVFIAAIVTVCVLALSMDTYVRHETVRGTLVPRDGFSRIRPPVSGIIAKVSVKAGDVVEAGDRLIALHRDSQGKSGTGVAQASIESLRSRIGLMKERKRLNDLEYQTSKTGLEASLVGQRQIVARLKEQVDIRADVLELLKARHEKLAKLASTGHIALIDIEHSDQRFLEASLQSQEISAQIATHEALIKSKLSELDSLQLSHLQQQHSIEEKLFELNSQLIALEVRKETWIVAGHSGQIDSVSAVLGDFATPQNALLTLIPPNSSLMAEMYLSGSAALLVKPKQSVHIKYDALPFQKHGTFEGLVESVSESVVPAPTGSAYNRSHASHFLVKASLAKQSIKSYGKVENLKAGMTFSADVIMEHRSLLDWLLDPLRAVTSTPKGDE
ncbi:MAG: HlyD family efflux transporter periplasmic adaptor subunit [Pseudomonadota bacterium]